MFDDSFQAWLEHQEQADRIVLDQFLLAEARVEAALAGAALPAGYPGDPPCRCLQIDVDIMNSSECPVHGPNSDAAREQKEREAQALAEYYAAEIPELQPITRKTVELTAPEFRAKGRVA